MTTETLQIQQLASGEVTVKLLGDHEFARPDDPATIPYVLIAALFKLMQDGTVFKKVEEVFGTTLEGSLNIVESKE